MDKSQILAAADKVATILAQSGIPTMVIGGIALAAHHHIRFTEDLDLCINVPINSLGPLASKLGENGFDAEVFEPDAEDPLGGVIKITGSFGIIELVNFGERFPAVLEDAARANPLSISPESPLKVIPLLHLIALKLYAGGHKSKADILQLIEKNPQMDLDALRALCAKYRLRGIDELIAEKS